VLGLYTLKEVGLLLKEYFVHNLVGVKNLATKLCNLGITMVFIGRLYSKYTGFS
jgi:hypothetical protein